MQCALETSHYHGIACDVPFTKKKHTLVGFLQVNVYSHIIKALENAYLIKPEFAFLVILFLSRTKNTRLQWNNHISILYK